jgi:hypothetical protein
MGDRRGRRGYLREEKMKATADFFDYNIIDVSNEDSEWPASDLKIYDSSTESFRTLNDNALTITLDFGMPLVNPTILMYGVNFSIMGVDGNSTNDWGAPPYISGNLTIDQDPELLVYKRSFTPTGFNYQFMRVSIPNQSTLDGKAVYEIGVLAIFETLKDFTAVGEGINVPVGKALFIPEVMNRSITNRKKIIPLTDRPVIEFRFNGTIRASVPNRRKFIDVFATPSKPIVYMERRIDINSWESYILQRSGQADINESMGGNSGVQSYQFTYETIL